MDLFKFSAMLNENIIQPMISYMEMCISCDDDCGYNEDDIARCESLLSDYLKALADMDEPSDEDIMEQVEQVVLALNELSDDSTYLLDDEAVSELICQLIQESAVQAGLSDPADDITEEWREW